MNHYVATLSGYIGDQTVANNWTGTVAAKPTCRNDVFNYTVDNIMPQEKQPRNPFNGLSYFKQKNDGNTAQSGLLYLGKQTDSGYEHYYFIYTGTDSPTATDWHAGMGLSLAELRNGIFMTRLRP